MRSYYASKMVRYQTEKGSLDLVKPTISHESALNIVIQDEHTYTFSRVPTLCFIIPLAFIINTGYGKRILYVNASLF
jgi:hypothetical protein